MCLQREGSVSSSMQPPGFSFQWHWILSQHSEAQLSQSEPFCVWGNPHHNLCYVSAQEPAISIRGDLEVSNGLMWKGLVHLLGWIWIKLQKKTPNIVWFQLLQWKELPCKWSIFGFWAMLDKTKYFKMLPHQLRNCGHWHFHCFLA